MCLIYDSLIHEIYAHCNDTTDSFSSCSGTQIKFELDPFKHRLLCGGKTRYFDPFPKPVLTTT